MKVKKQIEPGVSRKNAGKMYEILKSIMHQITWYGAMRQNYPNSALSNM